MSIFQQMKNSLIRFMYGRNGMDQLNRTLFVVYLVYCLARVVLVSTVQSLWIQALSDVVLYALMLLILFRIFSKNLYKRREENQKWLNWSWKLRSGWSGAKARHDDEAHKYFTCHQCKAICRVPVGKGKVLITCPKCGAQIHGKT